MPERLYPGFYRPPSQWDRTEADRVAAFPKTHLDNPQWKTYGESMREYSDREHAFFPLAGKKIAQAGRDLAGGIAQVASNGWDRLKDGISARASLPAPQTEAPPMPQQAGGSNMPPPMQPDRGMDNQLMNMIMAFQKQQQQAQGQESFDPQLMGYIRNIM